MHIDLNSQSFSIIFILIKNMNLYTKVYSILENMILCMIFHRLLLMVRLCWYDVFR